MLEKNVIDTKHYVYYSQGGTEEPANYSREHGNMPNKQGKPCLEGVSFCGERWTFDICLVMQSKSRILKPPVSLLLTLFFFMFYMPDLALRYKKPIYSSDIGGIEAQ